MIHRNRASQVAQGVKNTPANAGDLRDMGSVPESGRSSGGRHGNPLQYSCLGNPMDRGAWRLPSIRSQSAMTEVTEYTCINAGKARKTIPNLCISEPPKDKENGAVLV